MFNSTQRKGDSKANSAVSSSAGDKSTTIVNAENINGHTIKYLFETTTAVPGKLVICEAIKKGMIAIDWVDEYGNDLLSYAVNCIGDNQDFFFFYAFFKEYGGNINHANKYGQTALDKVIKLGDVSGVKNPRITAIQSDGGKYGHEIADGKAQQLITQQILPGFNPPVSSKSLIATPVTGFDLETKKLILVADLESEQHHTNTDYLNKVSVKEVLTNVKSSIGQLHSDNQQIATVILIREDWILTARHALSFRARENLVVKFANNDDLQIVSVVESGFKFDLDYIVLKLSAKINNIIPATLENEENPISLLSLGYYEQALYFVSFCNEDAMISPFQQLQGAGYQQTGITFSGSGYFNINENVCAIHSKASAQCKTWLYISLIANTNPDSVLMKLIQKKDIDDSLYCIEIDFFDEFVNAIPEFAEIDEGGPLEVSYKNENGKIVFFANSRPNNQSEPNVQDKIKKRVNKLKDNGKELTAIQQSFLDSDYKLKENKISIAHNIPISPMKDAMINKMNTPLETDEEKEQEETAAREFAEAIASSDDEESGECVVKKITGWRKKIRDAQQQGTMEENAEEILQETKELIKTVNKRSKNLMPGYSSVNSSIRHYRDPHLVKIADGKYEETEISKLLTEKSIAFFGKEYIKVKKNDNGETQSSSIDSGNKKSESYFKFDD